MTAALLPAGRRKGGRLSWLTLLLAVLSALAITALATHNDGGRVAAPTAPTERVVLSLSGTGSASSAEFAVGADWALHFSYSCGEGQSAVFRVVERGGAEDGVVLVGRLGGVGHGSTCAHGAAGRQRLVIETACHWSVVAVDGVDLPRADDATAV